MKKILLTVVLVALGAGLIFAQGITPSVPQPGAPAKTKVTGTLAWVKGGIAVQKDGTDYIARTLNQLVGFVDGLKEGATVTVEGYAFPMVSREKSILFHATTLTFNGKDYELASAPVQTTVRINTPGQRAKTDLRPQAQKRDSKNRCGQQQFQYGDRRHQSDRSRVPQPRTQQRQQFRYRSH
jgi:hypothetical protein